MSDLVERVAKAIAMDLGVQEDGVPYNLDDDLCANYVSQNHADFGRLARAAIAEVLDEVERHLSAVQYDPAPYTALKHRLAQFKAENIDRP